MAAKRWRAFQIGAMERFRKEDGHVARHLVDTQYLSRLAKCYLSHVCDPDRVWASPGRLTAMLRARWGLNGILGGGSVKNRRDHRHHAVDAFVIGCTDRGLLQKISRASGQAESHCPPFTQSTNQVAPSATLAQARGRARLQGGRPTAARGAWARRHLHTDEGGLPHQPRVLSHTRPPVPLNAA